jgi:hypothetical protein
VTFGNWEMEPQKTVEKSHLDQLTCYHMAVLLLASAQDPNLEERACQMDQKYLVIQPLGYQPGQRYTDATQSSQCPVSFVAAAAAVNRSFEDHSLYKEGSEAAGN